MKKYLHFLRSDGVLRLLRKIRLLSSYFEKYAAFFKSWKVYEERCDNTYTASKILSATALLRAHDLDSVHFLH